MALKIKTILQAQRTEIIVAKLTGEVSFGLVAELGDAFVDDTLVDRIIEIHDGFHTVLKSAEHSRALK